jgi:hypothetical protein
MILLLMNCAQEPTVEMALDFYENQPVYLRPFSLSKTPEGLKNMRAETCGECHQEIYREWSISTHANAWKNDPQFQAELHKERPNGGDVQWLCVNCHTPTIQQLPRLVARLERELDKPVYVENPYFDEQFQQEAISCAGCHIRDGVVLGPWGDSNAPHAVQKSDYLLTSQVCLDCHQADVSFQQLNLACVFNTGKEHQRGNYSDQTCQSCHMPLVERSIVPGGKKRTVRRHFFGGSMIPKNFEHADDIATMTPYYKQGLEVDDPIIQTNGDRLSIGILFRNANAGHNLPTGDPERFLLFTVKVIDESGEIQFHDSMTIGSKYDWWPSVKLISDNRLLPKEERSWDLVWKPIRDGKYTIELDVEKWRITSENLKYHQLENILPSHTSIFQKRAHIVVSLPEKK